MTSHETMQAVEISQPGAADVLKLCTRPIPVPKANEVLIRVIAAGVNRPDVLQRMGLYPPPDGASDLPGLEVSGEVVAIGDAVTGLEAGNRVCALLPGGGYAQYAVVDAGACLPCPPGVALEDAAALPETVFTVWANVFDSGKLTAGETMLVHGGTSGIGVTAIGMAKAAGATVVATASSDDKCAEILQLGADKAYRYDLDGWETSIAADGGADLVLDMTGGDFVQRNLHALNPGGCHISIAFLRGAAATVNIMSIMAKRLSLSGSTMKSRDAEEKARLADDIQRVVWPWFGAGKISPIIDKRFPLAEASAAHLRMESGKHVGKIILDMPD